MASRVVSIDYETYYGDDHSLAGTKGKTMEAYIRGPEFEPIMLTAYDGTQDPIVAVGETDIHNLVKDLGLNRNDTLTIAHNMAFDGAITSWHFREYIRTPVCTASLARDVGLGRIISVSLDSVSTYLRERGYPVGIKGDAVHNAKNMHLADMSPEFLASYIEYGKQDSVICYQIFKIMMEQASQGFIDEVAMTLKMYMYPSLVLNTEKLEVYGAKQHHEKEGTYTALARKYGYSDVNSFRSALRSPPQFAELLRSIGVTPPLKVSENKTKTAQKKDPNAEPVMTYAFAKDDLAIQQMLQRGRPEVKELLNAKIALSSSINETRTATMLEISKRGPLPISLGYAVAHTIRYGAFDKTNTQNLPKRTGDTTLREAIEAPEGCKLVAADSSQVEARCLAYAANQFDLLNIFRTGGDPYSEMASIIYSAPTDVIFHYAKVAKPTTDESKAQIKVNKHRRNVGKETILSSGYQISGNAFAERLVAQGIEFEPEQGMIDTWSVAWVKEHGMPTTQEARFNYKDALADYKYSYHVAECVRINRLYRQKHSAIRQFWQICANVLAALVRGENGFFGGPTGDLFFFDGTHNVFGTPVPGIRLPNGYWILYPNLRVHTDEETGRTRFTFLFRDSKGKTMIKNVYGGSVTENLMQGLAFSILLWQGVNISKQVPIALNTHDEWLSVVEAIKSGQVASIYEKEMRRVPPWTPNLPLDCEVAIGDNYAQC